jgi:hypothetical protein
MALMISASSPCALEKIPCSAKKFPCSVEQGIWLQAIESALLLERKSSQMPEIC